MWEPPEHPDMVPTPSGPASFPVTAPAGSRVCTTADGVGWGWQRKAWGPRFPFTKLPQGPPASEGPLEPGRNPDTPKVTSQAAQPWTREAASERQGPFRISAHQLCSLWPEASASLS